ncbi:hypothetical protein HNQ51_000636 [Inhella inkyongensis]|uniref:Outer membrane protein beta-barrel domain-containing protein n=1 Tax=Inhella inkyongensis TaxID=392593 RepID=A0A840S0N8_9BURK|nr:hypothetical protein [Inhella inkyongensis]MBB5203343.1 hypothetical protein [Inhella inkyongensis]
MRHLAAALLLSTWGSMVLAADGLRLPGAEASRWQGRVQLLSSDDLHGSRVLGAHLLGDYYLSDGLRLSGGLMVGPMALLGSGAGLTLGSRPGIALGQQSLRGQFDSPSLRQPYLGMGYSSQGEAWRFSADLGVAMRGTGAGLSLRSMDALDASLRGLQFTPVLQFGLSYRF